MQVHATTNKVLFSKPSVFGWDTVQVKSRSNPDVSYTVDMTFGRCSCPAWKFSKAINGVRKPCKHLKALGFKIALHSEDVKEYKEQQNQTVVEYEEL